MVACLRDDGERLLVGLMLYAGLRASEARGLDWEDIELGERKLLVRRGKGAKQRWVPIARPLMPLLGEGGDKRGWSGPILLGRTGNRLPGRTLRERIKRIGRRAGISWLHPHALRHTCASAVWKATHDIRLVQELLGHANIATTQIYVHLDVGDVRNGLDEVAWC